MLIVAGCLSLATMYVRDIRNNAKRQDYNNTFVYHIANMSSQHTVLLQSMIFKILAMNGKLTMAALSARLSSNMNGLTAAILSPEVTLDTFEDGLTTVAFVVELGVAGVTGVLGEDTNVSDSEDFRLTFFFLAAGPRLIKNKTIKHIYWYAIAIKPHH